MSKVAPFAESQKLVRCEAINRYGESSIRIVEINAFKMWKYLMTHKHGQQINNPSICLWVNQDEFEQKDAVFEHSGQAEPVSRIVVDLFDREYGFSQTSIRYAREGETEQLVQILKSHIPEALRNSDACSVDVIAGQLVQQWQHQTSRPMILGLEA